MEQGQAHAAGGRCYAPGRVARSLGSRHLDGPEPQNGQSYWRKDNLCWRSVISCRSAAQIVQFGPRDGVSALSLSQSSAK
jgi:hypothetical protein